MRYFAKCARNCQKNAAGNDNTEERACILTGAFFMARPFLTPIIQDPPGISQQFHRNNELSFSPVRPSPGIALRLRIAGSCECRVKALRRSGIEIRLPLSAHVEVGSQDALHIPESECSFFFMMLPPVNHNRRKAFSNCRGNSSHFKRHRCRVSEK